MRGKQTGGGEIFPRVGVNAETWQVGERHQCGGGGRIRPLNRGDLVED